MRTRGSPGSEPSRADRADAAARRLALLAADIGATDLGPEAEPWPPDDSDFTRVVPSRRAVPPAEPRSAPPPEPVAPVVPVVPVVPRPGRHAARRRRASSLPRMPGLPGLGAPQLTVLA